MKHQLNPKLNIWFGTQPENTLVRKSSLMCKIYFKIKDDEGPTMRKWKGRFEQGWFYKK